MSSNLIALCWLSSGLAYQRIPGILLVFTRHARTFCANFLRLSEPRSLVNPFFSGLFKPLRGRPTMQNIKTAERPDIGVAEHLAPDYCPAVAWVCFGWPRDVSSIALITAIKRLDCAPACQFHPYGYGAKLLNLVPVQSSSSQRITQTSVLFAAACCLRLVQCSKCSKTMQMPDLWKAVEKPPTEATAHFR